MNIESTATGTFEEICYIVWDTQQQALVFDPGFDAPQISAVLEKHKLEVAAYICTHAHADHINALAAMHRQYPAPIAMHTLDLEWAFEPVNQIMPYYPTPERPDVESFLRLEHSAVWSFADLHFQCMQTPGHSPGSCCLLFPDSGILISGDTLFKGSCGRTNLPGGNPQHLKESLNKLKQLPDEIRVFPGHGPDTAIGIERMTNYYMQ